MVIANAAVKDVLQQVLAGELIGTLFCARQHSLVSRKRWIAYGQTEQGRLIVDAGARKALMEEGKSLLPSGVVSVDGEFHQGDMVIIEDERGREIARGLVNYSAAELRLIRGMKTEEAAVLLQRSCQEAVHRNNMVVTG